MKTSKIIVLVTIVGLIIIGLIYCQHYLNNNVEYQMKILESGSVEEKLYAADVLGNKKVVNAVPLLIENIDNTDSATYINSKKSPESISCCATFSLDSITRKNIGNTCCFDCEDKKREVINKWKDWYKNEYPKWIEENKNK